VKEMRGSCASEGVFALRDDLGTPSTSEPFVLIRYRDPNNGGQWRWDKVGWSVDAVGASAAGAEEASLWNFRFNPKATSPSTGTALKVAGKTTAIYQATTKMINAAAPRIAAQQEHARGRLNVLKRATARLYRTNQKVLKADTRSLAELNAAIQRQERINRRSAAQARYWEAKARKAQE
jgi:hypothetical protein